MGQDLDKWLYDTIDDSEETVEKLYNTPKGFISLRDWRKVVAGDGKRDYFVNKIILGFVTANIFAGTPTRK